MWIVNHAFATLWKYFQVSNKWLYLRRQFLRLDWKLATILHVQRAEMIFKVPVLGLRTDKRWIEALSVSRDAKHPDAADPVSNDSIDRKENLATHNLTARTGQGIKRVILFPHGGVWITWPLGRAEAAPNELNERVSRERVSKWH